MIYILYKCVNKIMVFFYMDNEYNNIKVNLWGVELISG